MHSSESTISELSCPSVQGDCELPELNLQDMDLTWPSTDERIELDEETMAWVAELSDPQADNERSVR